MVQREHLGDVVSQLARELQGAIEVARLGGVEWLPRPRFPSAPSPIVSLAVPEAPDVPGATDAQVAPHPTLRSQAAQLADRPAIASAPASAFAGAPLPVLAAADADTALDVIVRSPVSAAVRLERLRTEAIGDCQRCRLHRGRHRIVFGSGNPEAQIVFVGEAPGAEEDRQGLPFVGDAGQLLTRMISAMGRSRDDVYICNVLKCRPPNNRDPAPDEVEMCERFLKAQLAIIRPRAIVALGTHAAHSLLRTRAPISRLRGVWHTYDVTGTDIPLMPTYHPAFLLRQGHDPKQQRKREAWSDLQLVMAACDAPRPS